MLVEFKLVKPQNVIAEGVEKRKVTTNHGH